MDVSKPSLALDDEPRIVALLATAYEQPVGPQVLAKIRRACELWNAGEKARACRLANSLQPWSRRRLC
jgi:hypothetical protein